MTTRERKEARLERRLEWAASRERKAAEAFSKVHAIADNIPLGQPILVGHHSESRARRDQSRIESGMRQGVESAHMADHHISKAEGIQRQLDNSIYNDDPDAIERLQEKIARLEAQRDARKECNKIYKREVAAGTSALDTFRIIARELGEDIALEGARTLKYQPYYKVPYPTYSLSNIGAAIRTAKKRLEALQA